MMIDFAAWIDSHIALSLAFICILCGLILMVKQLYMTQEQIEAIRRMQVPARIVPMTGHMDIEPDDSLMDFEDTEISTRFGTHAKETTMEEFEAAKNYPTLEDVMILPTPRTLPVNNDLTALDRYAEVQREAEETNSIEAAQRVLDRIQARKA